MIKNIKLKNFRKFIELELYTDSQVVLLTGANATGKTSILEAIYFIATTKSHRTNEQETMIHQNSDFSEIEIEAEKKYKIILSKQGKTNYINDISYSKLSEFIGNLDVIMVSPLDISLINGSKGVRRRFLDLEISLLDKSYLRAIMVYKKLLKERNELLKAYNEEKKVILEVITHQLEENIHFLYQKRISFIELLNKSLVKVTDRLNCEKIRLEYEPSYDINNLQKSFSQKLNYDLLSKTTNIGLHRDNVKIFMNEDKIENYASEGQTRTAILAIKLAVKEIYAEKGKKVILLLDDIFSSIDQKRMNHIMNYIKNEQQTFITTTSLFQIPDELIRKAKIIKL